MIFLHFLNHLNLPTRFMNICLLNIKTQTSLLNRKILAHFRFQTLTFAVKTVYLSLVFTENNGVFINHESFILTYQKRGLLHTLLHRSFSICCDFETFHFEIDHLKTILIKNNYPLNFIDSCIKLFLNKLYTPKVMVPNVPKRNVFVKLLFLGSTSFQI